MASHRGRAHWPSSSSCGGELAWAIRPARPKARPANRGSTADGAGRDVLVVSLEHRVEVGAAEAEGADAGAARAIGLGVEPRLGLGAKPERALAQVELGVGSLDADGRRQDFVIRASARR